jgi:hypothetical protein
MSKGGSSSQSQNSTYTDNRAVVGQDGTYANNGSNVTSNTNTTNYVLDNGAVNSALDLAGNAVGGAFNTASNLTGAALNFGSDALAKVDASQSKAFNFSSDVLGGAADVVRSTVTQALNFGNDAVSSALSSNDANLTKAFNFGSDSLSMADSFYTRALDYSTSATDQALSNLQRTQDLTAAAYNDAKGRGALTDKIIIGAIGAMAIVAFMALKK